MNVEYVTKTIKQRKRFFWIWDFCEGIQVATRVVERAVKAGV